MAPEWRTMGLPCSSPAVSTESAQGSRLEGRGHRMGRRAVFLISVFIARCYTSTTMYTSSVLEDQLEDQWKPRQDERPPSPGHLYVGSFSKATPSKCLRLYCSSSSTTQPQNQTTQSSIVLSRITTSSVCPPLTVAGLPVATQAVRTPHRLFNHYTTGNTSAGKRGRAGSVALHASSRVTVLNTTTESGLGTPLQVLHLTQEREQESGDMESQRLGKERIVLVQQGVLLDTPEIQTH
ncbi:uncharacterized protein LOC118364162 isoform X3 [Oncorhynchus keta]|uniref:uncharacterized protein LOC118364162 isoform X3 n=1 Tax=Oncorhynchus keta TaxID=8018 RepID=UPI00227BEAE9|nr:uncharacterized protein LOC118364162 isoform X3 [Oncorhynchus keta]